MADSLLEDHRGVDLGQIRDRRALTPAERLQRLVDEVRTLQAMLEYANRTS